MTNGSGAEPSAHRDGRVAPKEGDSVGSSLGSLLGEVTVRVDSAGADCHGNIQASLSSSGAEPSSGRSTGRLPWRKRSDLQFAADEGGGWIVKDPLTLQYLILNDLEFHLLQLLDGRRTFDELLSEVRQRFTDHRLAREELTGFLQMLAGCDLIRAVKAPSRRGSGDRPGQYFQRLVLPVFQVMRFRKSLLNPSRSLDVLLPWLKWIFTSQAFMVFVLLNLLAVTLVGLRFHEFVAQIPDVNDLLSQQNILTMLVIFILVKVLHEAGHALSARHFGAECNDCGVMLMVFTPVLYTSVSDAWMLPGRQRMIISAAGIFVELLIASVCGIAWFFAVPGVFRSLLTSTILLCSVNTLLFNGNPLLRFDGYFLLMDGIRVPNLASRASQQVQQLFRNAFTGIPSRDVEPGRAILLGYGFLSAIYRAILTIAVLKLINHVFAGHNLRVTGAVFMLIVASGFLVLPVVRLITAVRHDLLTATPNQVCRTFFRTAVAAVIAISLLLVPLPCSVTAPGVTEPGSFALYSTLSGNVKPSVRYGDTVASGQIVAELKNSELELSRQRMEGRVRELQIQLDLLTGNAATAGSSLIPALREALRGAVRERQQFEAETESLMIRSPVSGVLFSPAEVLMNPSTDVPVHWVGLPLEAKNTNAWLARGTLLGYVIPQAPVLSDRRAHEELVRDGILVTAFFNEDDIELIRPGQSAAFLLNGGGNECVTGAVLSVAQLDLSSIPEPVVLSRKVNAQKTESGYRPMAVTYAVTIAVDRASSASLLLNAVGDVRIDVRRSSLAGRFVRFVQQTF